jgi:3-oxoacyl-[acyl-carrier protein] reductase
MKSVLMTGATGAIGEAISAVFQKNGYEVIAPTRAELNLTDEQSIQQYLSTLKTDVDVFVHCAGINDPKQLHDLTEADIQKTFQINTMSFYTICKFLSTGFKKKNAGHILGVSSIYGEYSRRGRLAYAASKHALNGMVKSLAIEMGEYNVKVNGIAPGFIDTKMTRKNNSEEVIAGFKRKIPLARLGQPNDIAEIVYFLCSPQNAYINGQCIIADGGYSVGGFQE